MPEKDRICTISGPRPYKLPSRLDLSELLLKMEEEIRKSAAQGYMAFQTGMAMGVDIWAAEIVLRLKSELPEIRLVCCLPCKTQADGWPNDWRERYMALLDRADDVVCLQAHYTDGCMQRRNCRMIDTSSRLIAVCGGASAGGTAHTVNYAKKQGIDIVMINPSDYLRDGSVEKWNRKQ